MFKTCLRRKLTKEIWSKTPHCGCLQQWKNTLQGLRYHSEQNITSNGEVRVRFAPSPTGQLHLGGLRSALYNHLFARAHRGKFILRIEDTDQRRVVPGAMEKLSEMLYWAGIQVNEGPAEGGPYGPYIQSHRKPLYDQYINILLEKGSAYRCFCSKKRLDLLRKEALKLRETPKYDNNCRYLSQTEVQEKLSQNLPHVIRFKLDSSALEQWTDLVYGTHILSDVTRSEGDPVLIKADGYPTYHFANVVDDHMMKISHVLRGVEWQVSTVKHLLLYKAFDWTPPQYAHLPLLLNKHGKKLSKRENDIHVEYLKDKGYFAEALHTFMCSMGSGFTIPQKEILHTDAKHLHLYFDLTKMNTNNTKLDFDRLDECNKRFMFTSLRKQDSKEQMVTRVRHMVNEHYKHRPDSLEENALDENYISKVLEWSKEDERITVINDFLKEDFSFLWVNESIGEHADNLSKTLKIHSAEYIIQTFLSALNSLDEDHTKDVEFLHQWLSQLISQHKLNKKEFFTCCRYFLYGKLTGPPVAELVYMLGKERTISRLRTAIDKLQTNSEQSVVNS